MKPSLLRLEILDYLALDRDKPRYTSEIMDAIISNSILSETSKIKIRWTLAYLRDNRNIKDTGFTIPEDDLKTLKNCVTLRGRRLRDLQTGKFHEHRWIITNRGLWYLNQLKILRDNQT